MKNGLSKIIRIITLPPVIALAALLTLWFVKGFFNTSWELIVGIVCLTVLPSLAYAVQPLVKSLRQNKREGQRKLAVIFSVAGYLICNLVAWFTPSTDKLKIFYLTYLLSATAIFLYGKCFGIKCSGHASGLCGPIAFLGCFVNVWILFAEILIIPLIWASTNIKQHSIAEMALGALVPVVSMALSFIVFGVLPHVA